MNKKEKDLIEAFKSAKKHSEGSVWRFLGAITWELSAIAVSKKGKDFLEWLDAREQLTKTLNEITKELD